MTTGHPSKHGTRCFLERRPTANPRLPNALSHRTPPRSHEGRLLRARVPRGRNAAALLSQGIRTRFRSRGDRQTGRPPGRSQLAREGPMSCESCTCEKCLDMQPPVCLGGLCPDFWRCRAAKECMGVAKIIQLAAKRHVDATWHVPTEDRDIKYFGHIIIEQLKPRPPKLPISERCLCQNCGERMPHSAGKKYCSARCVRVAHDLRRSLRDAK